MQGARASWITDDAYDPQILADLPPTTQTVCNPIETKAAVMDTVRLEGCAEKLKNGLEDTVDQIHGVRSKM